MWPRCSLVPVTCERAGTARWSRYRAWLALLPLEPAGMQRLQYRSWSLSPHVSVLNLAMAAQLSGIPSSPPHHADGATPAGQQLDAIIRKNGVRKLKVQYGTVGRAVRYDA